jgi:hypothetical protein
MFVEPSGINTVLIKVFMRCVMVTDEGRFCR